MTGVLTLAWFHYLAMMFVAAALVAEHLMFTPRPELPLARKLLVVNRIHGISVLVALITGFGRMMHGGKGAVFYMQNTAFQLKFVLFIVLALAWFYAAMTFFSWGQKIKAGNAPVVSEDDAKRVLMAIRLQLLILVLLPLLATMMARGLWS